MKMTYKLCFLCGLRFLLVCFWMSYVVHRFKHVVYLL